MKKVCLFIALIASACGSQKNIVVTGSDATVIDGKIFTALYQQKAAEYKALCFQAYNIATFRLEQALLQPKTTLKAVVTDIDETLLDNSAYAVHQAFKGRDYDPNSWIDWTSRAAADTLAGALTFFKYAASRNVEVFYITNREEKERAGTLKNLQQYGFPYADEAHLITKVNVSSKELRRQQVASTHEILLFLGDNLADFSALFDHKSTDERTLNVQSSSADFGNKFIVLPNPNYGDWESALYQYNYRLTPAQKDSIIRNSLKNY
jgi:5'-nucleotidase (lipoprotein e(P4) family)